jgi:hypothetical protein
VILTHQNRLVGGGTLVASFICAVTFFSFRDLSTIRSQHQEFTAAQIDLMSRLAEAGARPTRLYGEAPEPLPGRLIAAKVDAESFEVVWEKSDDPKLLSLISNRDRQLAKIYSCRIEQNPEGFVPVCDNGRAKIAVSATAVDPRIKNGEQVLALVPDKTVSISKIFPLQAAASK